MSPLVKPGAHPSPPSPPLHTVFSCLVRLLPACPPQPFLTLLGGALSSPFLDPEAPKSLPTCLQTCILHPLSYTSSHPFSAPISSQSCLLQVQHTEHVTNSSSNFYNLPIVGDVCYPWLTEGQTEVQLCSWLVHSHTAAWCQP